MKLILLFMLLLFHEVPLRAESSPEEDWENFKKSQCPITHVNLDYETSVTPEEDEIDSDITYYEKKCKQETLKNFSTLLSHFSKVDSLILLEECASAKVKNWKPLEEKTKQKIFTLSKFPKFEILTVGDSDEGISELTRKVTQVWQERVYTFSNFYHQRSLLWLGEEKEFTDEINRVLYTDMNEKRKTNLLRKLIQDLEASNQRIYHLFQYSSRNPFLAKSLYEENQRSKETLQRFLHNVSMEDEISAIQKEKLESFIACLDNINLRGQGVRLSGFLGFWQDYEFLNELTPKIKGEKSQSIPKFLKKTIYNSHHFEGRLEKGLNACRALAQLKLNDE